MPAVRKRSVAFRRIRRASATTRHSHDPWFHLRGIKPKGDHDFDAFESMHMYASIPNLMVRSAHIRSTAISWRGFQVGTSAIAIGAEGRRHTYDAVNHKPHNRRRNFDLGDMCGEMKAIIEARADRRKAILAMVVTAEAQIDDVSKEKHGVTISCAHCRAYFRRELKYRDSPLKPYTRLVYVDTITGFIKQMTVAEIVKTRDKRGFRPSIGRRPPLPRLLRRE